METDWIQVFVDYVDIRQNLESTVKILHGSHVGSTPAQHAEAGHRLAAYARTVPKLLQLVPTVLSDRQNVQNRAALADVLSYLHMLASSLSSFVSRSPLPCHCTHLGLWLNADGIQIPRPPVTPLLVDVDRLHLLQDTAGDAFMRNLQSCATAV